MCAQCRDRFDRNPLRILDCKEEKCKAVTAGAPRILDYLCDDCAAHFREVQDRLSDLGIPFVVNAGIVRGLDYYTRTVFEFISDAIGAQGTVCGGGRYNNLVEEVGGKSTPAVGFGLGLERLLMVLENTGKLNAPEERSDLYVASMGERAGKYVPVLAAQLRAQGVRTEFDISARGLKAQMKYADKIDARYSIVLGDNEIEQNTAKVKNMETGETAEVTLDGHFMEKFIEIQLSDEQKNK